MTPEAAADRPGNTTCIDPHQAGPWDVIILDRLGNWILAPTSARAVLDPELRVSLPEVSPCGSHGARIGSRAFPLVSRVAEGLAFPVSELAAARAALEGAGVEVRERIDQGPECPSGSTGAHHATCEVELDERYLRSLEPGHQGRLRRLAALHRGVLEVSGPAEAHAFAFRLCRALPTARVALVVANKAQRRGLLRRLRRDARLRGRAPRDATVNFDRAHIHAHPASRIDSLNPGENYHVVVFLDARLLVHRRGIRALTTAIMPTTAAERLLPPERPSLVHGPAAHLRVYSMLVPGRMHPGDRRLLHALGGPLVPVREDVPARVRVAWVPGTGSAPQAEGGLARRRWVLDDEGRNDRLARAALAVASGDGDSLRGLGLVADGPPLGPAAGGRRVGVLVEHPPHARLLLGLLPGWRALGRGDGVGEMESPDRAVFTFAALALAKAKGLGLDVLVRADGGPEDLGGMIDLAPGPHGPGELLVVDVADHTEAAGQRDAGYARRGWLTGARPGPS